MFIFSFVFRNCNFYNELRAHPILFITCNNLIQTELDSTQSYYHCSYYYLLSLSLSLFNYYIYWYLNTLCTLLVRQQLRCCWLHQFVYWEANLPVGFSEFPATNGVHPRVEYRWSETQPYGPQPVTIHFQVLAMFCCGNLDYAEYEIGTKKYDKTSQWRLLQLLKLFCFLASFCSCAAFDSVCTVFALRWQNCLFAAR